MWEAAACHLVWPSRQQRVETAESETKLAVASVSGVASPWVRWAILTEGRERSAAPLLHKPLYRIPHHVLMASWERGGGVIQWQVRERRRKLSFAQSAFFVGKRRLPSAVESSESGDSLRTWRPETGNSLFAFPEQHFPFSSPHFQFFLCLYDNEMRMCVCECTVRGLSVCVEHKPSIRGQCTREHTMRGLHPDKTSKLMTLCCTHKVHQPDIWQ